MSSKKPRIRGASVRRVTLYSVLEVPPGASPETLRDRYLAIAREAHDRGSYGDKFADVTAAYATLRDDDKRRNYDAVLALYSDKCKKCDGKGLVAKSKQFSSRYTVPCTECKGTGWEERGKA